MIYLDNYAFRVKSLDRLTEEKLEPLGVASPPKGKVFVADDFIVGWGYPPRGCRGCVMESGFFRFAYHIDRLGLYQHSSFSTLEGRRAVDSYDPPYSMVETVRNCKRNYSKYPQGQDPEFAGSEVDWKGVVLASQNPGDRSVLAGASADDYYRFYRRACKYYGGNLFVKLHPWNSGEVGEELRRVAKLYGCQVGKVNHRVIENCEFVVVYNSTFAVDCFMRGKKVAQYAPGYFYQLPCVTYTRGHFYDRVTPDVEWGYRLCDFLLWKYCFNQKMTEEMWVKIFNVFGNSWDMFPLPEDLSYAGTWGEL